MTGIELLADLRSVLDDAVLIDAGWTDARLYALLSEGERNFCKDTGYFRDRAQYHIATVAGVESYALDPKIIEVYGIREDVRPLCQMDEQIRADYDVIYGLAALPHAINTAYVVGDKVALTSGGNDFMLLCSVAGTTGAVAPAIASADIGTVVADNTASWKVQAYYVDYTNVPGYWETDVASNLIHFYPPPDGVYVLSFDVQRYPLVDISAGTNPTIPAELQRACVEYAAYKAYLDGDDETSNLGMANQHLLEYQKYMRDGKSLFQRRAGFRASVSTPPEYRT